jgi:eukaryotic-like serine/threonine-protein kinase
VSVLLVALAGLVVVAAVLVVRQLSGDSAGGNPPASSGSKQKSGSRDGGGNAGKGTGQDSSSSDGSSDSGSSEEADKEQLVRDYYDAAPGGTDEAWAMLGPGMQEQGRDRYQAFWRTIDSVDVQSAKATPGSDSVQVTLVYHTSDGRTSTEHKVEGLVESGGDYLIDSDEPAS